MLNVFKVKRIASFILASFIPATTFGVLLFMYGIWAGIIGLIFSSIIMIFIGSAMIKNPFRSVLEGKGILGVTMDSTGILDLFVLGVWDDKLKGRCNGLEVEDIFNREAVFQTRTPKTGSYKVIEEGEHKGTIVVALDQPEFNRARFSMLGIPTVIWNKQAKSILTKEFFSEKEKDSFAEHSIIYLNKNLKELNNTMRDFARGVVDTINQKSGGLLGNKWTWIIIAVAVVIMIILFGAPILESITSSGAVSSASSAVSNAGNTAQAGSGIIVGAS